MVGLAPLVGFVEGIGIDEHQIAGLNLIDRVLNEVVALSGEQIVHFKFRMVVVVPHGIIADSPVKFNPEGILVGTEANSLRKG
ncbi:hypothetical protein D3C71_2102840 [compost metagenome]